MKFNDKKMVARKHVTRKEFSYEKNGTTLAFTLRVDVKTELEAFEDMMKAALVEVRQEIERIEKK